MLWDDLEDWDGECVGREFQEGGYNVCAYWLIHVGCMAETNITL